MLSVKLAGHPFVCTQAACLHAETREKDGGLVADPVLPNGVCFDGGRVLYWLI